MKNNNWPPLKEEPMEYNLPALLAVAILEISLLIHFLGVDQDNNVNLLYVFGWNTFALLALIYANPSRK